jgi:hypothetical protein
MAEIVGRIALLQVQRRRLKGGGVYDPDPLVSSDRMLLTREGVLADVAAGWVIDTHHASHPERPHWSGRATVSIGFTSHYRKIEDRFGPKPLGVGGENIIVETDRIWTIDELAPGLVIVTALGPVLLTNWRIAEPCVPFTRFLLGEPDASVHDVQDDLAFLKHGTRGFVTAMDNLSEPVEIRVGDEVRLAGHGGS